MRRGEEDYEESSGSPELVLIPPRPLWDSAYETLCYALPEWPKWSQQCRLEIADALGEAL